MKRGDFLEQRLGVIRERVERGDYVISFTHTEKLRERKIGAEDIEEAIRNGVIIEDIAMTREDRVASFSAGQVAGPFMPCAVGSKRSRS